jgi:hypothetical protein
MRQTLVISEKQETELQQILNELIYSLKKTYSEEDLLTLSYQIVKESGKQTFDSKKDTTVKLFKAVGKFSGKTYSSARLTFKRDIIEPLGMDDKFTIYVSNDGGRYTMSKADFYRVFNNVVNSKSYLKYGIYSYTITSQKTQEFFQIQGEEKKIDKKIEKVNSPENLEISKKESGKSIGKYVQSTLREIINDDLINLNEIKRLQGADYSKATFDIQYPFLAKENSKYYDHKRYYVNPYLIKGELYFLCSQWYENPSNDDRPYYEKWLKKMKNKNS